MCVCARALVNRFTKRIPTPKSAILLTSSKGHKAQKSFLSHTHILTTTVYRLWRLFNVEWYERIVPFGEFERIRDGVVVVYFKVLGGTEKSHETSQDSLFPLRFERGTPKCMSEALPLEQSHSVETLLIWSETLKSFGLRVTRNISSCTTNRWL